MGSAGSIVELQNCIGTQTLNMLAKESVPMTTALDGSILSSEPKLAMETIFGSKQGADGVYYSAEVVIQDEERFIRVHL